MMCWGGRVGVAAAFALLIGFAGWFAALPVLGRLEARPWTWVAAQALAGGLVSPAAAGIYEWTAVVAAVGGAALGCSVYALIVPLVSFDHVFAAAATALAADFAMTRFADAQTQAAMGRLCCCCRSGRRAE